MQVIQANKTQKSVSMKKFVVREAESLKTTAPARYDN